jgi:lysophospholipase L1-like esterase
MDGVTPSVHRFACATVVGAALVAVACSSPVAPTRGTSRVPRLARTRFLAFGDSITAGEVTVPVSTLSEGGGRSRLQIQVLSAAYPTVLADLLRGECPLQSSEIVVVNAGKGAEPMAIAVPRFLDTVDEQAPEVLLLLGGYNDLLMFGGDGVERAAAAMQTMAIEAKARGERVFIATLTPNRPNRQRTISTSLLLALNDRLRSIAAAERLVLVDLYPALLTSVDTYIGIDGLHPTEIGYRRIAETFFAAVVSDLEVR